MLTSELDTVIAEWEAREVSPSAAGGCALCRACLGPTGVDCTRCPIYAHTEVSKCLATPIETYGRAWRRYVSPYNLPNAPLVTMAELCLLAGDVVHFLRSIRDGTAKSGPAFKKARSRSKSIEGIPV